MKSLAFFNNKGGVGKTSLVYHLAWMFADRGKRVLAVDLDPQANLTSMFLDEPELERIWPLQGSRDETIFGSLNPIIRGTGDVQSPRPRQISSNLSLLVGDLALSTFEDKLSAAWLACYNKDEAAFRTMTAFYRLMNAAARQTRAEVVIVDVGPNLGAINRATMISCDKIVVPLAPDLFSLQGLWNLGPSLRAWRDNWREMASRNPNPDLEIPLGTMDPIGYVAMQHSMREGTVPKAYKRWLSRFPSAFRTAVLGEQTSAAPAVEDDPYCLAMLKHYRSLMVLAMEARKPIFYLKAGDGAIGSHLYAVKDCYTDFLSLATTIATRIGLPMKTSH